MLDHDTNPWTRWARYVGPDETAAIAEAVKEAEALRPHLNRLAELCAKSRFPVTLASHKGGALLMSDAAVECLEGDSGFAELRDLLLDMSSVLVYATGDEDGDYETPEWAERYPTGEAMTNAYYATPAGKAELALRREELQQHHAEQAEIREAKEREAAAAAGVVA